MIHYLAQALLPHFSALNVFTYHTVRAGGAALTGFFLCLLIGPRIIKELRRFEVGQHIKEEHVAALHALHKAKAGTPTMGGIMIILSTIFSLLLWSTLTNRLMWVALGVFILLGAVGFIDDLIKLKRKHNDGLSARAKFIGQVFTGALLGLYLVANPIATSPSTLSMSDIEDWNALRAGLEAGRDAKAPSPAKRLWERLPPEAFKSLAYNDMAYSSARSEVVRGLNNVLAQHTFYAAEYWPENALIAEAKGLLEMRPEKLEAPQLYRLNRLLLEAAFPAAIRPALSQLHTRVGVPGFKNLFVPLGVFYVFFVILIIVSVSNAVNITDGLDGLAVGASIISIFTYAAIAYVISRADWSEYLYLIYIPEASELFVFGGALLGTGLGFLWFNSHPAEVFMGDTGSLALGGAIATLAILTKQELLLPMVAGLFVIEAASVVLQVASYKLTGKRIFRMAPIHHHFELLGWSETKVTMRFWIIAFLFAMMSLGTLKLR